MSDEKEVNTEELMKEIDLAAQEGKEAQANVMNNLLMGKFTLKVEVSNDEEKQWSESVINECKRLNLQFILSDNRREDSVEFDFQATGPIGTLQELSDWIEWYANRINQ